jgi:hypothetical protein
MQVQEYIHPMRLPKHISFVEIAGLIVLSLIARGVRASVHQGANKPEHVYLALSSSRDGSPPKTVFACEGKIYAFLLFSAPTAGKHRIDGNWFRPDGSLQEHARVEVNISKAGKQKASLWLQFAPHQESAFDEFKFGGDYGRHGNAFNGSWTLQVLYDGQLAAQTTFSVVCEE